ncbi:hypothetical protein GVX81_09500 [[Haemophilus] felis]|uniref:Uncharacterized protein n=1 Tax=[Haemophilus] felis TaxID=123822 RepID=A0A1T0ATS6_9PAST|nr:hypothetical protein [[Haemophilus] felis]NBI41818.1 hypothetical protein [[Haemophilus] felis]OOS00007.1 hypothetical protein B0188_10955 [[Haemophilus] felis]
MKIEKNELLEIEKLLPKMHEKVFNGEVVSIEDFKLDIKKDKISREIRRKIDGFYYQIVCELRYNNWILKNI